MDPETLYPLFRDSWVLHDDGDVIVVDKPSGLSTHETEPGDENHTVFRLAAWLRKQGKRDYLGIHQRLDKDTSGVLLFSRNPEKNKALAAEFENRRIEKRYVAAVILPMRIAPEGTLRGFVVKEKGGVVSIHSKKPRGPAQEAITHYRILDRKGARALLTITPETGRMHQIRAQLAAANMPIAGDTLYQGPPCARLLLHAESLALLHPTTHKRFHVTSTLPISFRRWLQGESTLPKSAPLLADRLRRAAELRATLFHQQGPGGQRATTAFRIANGAGDDVPGITVDQYNDYFVVSLVSPEAEALRDEILDAVFSLGPAGVYLKSRPKQARTLAAPELAERAPKTAVRGKTAEEEFTLFENGIPYRARLGDGLQTGFFLDQRDNRKRVIELARGKRVLNLFGYTGAFTVAAFVGGAEKTTTVDVSASALARARQNLALSGAIESDHLLFDVDALFFLKGAHKRGEEFDLVIVDPPSFATTKTSTFSAKDDLATLLSWVLRVTSSGGKVLASTNHRGISRAKLRKLVHDAAREAGRDLLQTKDLPGTLDFPPEPMFDPAMKSLLITVGNR